MYAYIQGTVAAKSDGVIVIDNGGIGYAICVSAFTQSAVEIGTVVKLLTYLYVKEDIFMLYGFRAQEEKSFFEKLLTVSGVGAKTAMGILGGYPLGELMGYVACGNVAMLSKIKGLGKKTAERIVLELKEQYNSLLRAEDITDVAPVETSSEIDDAVFALVSLGIPKQEALKRATDAAKHVSGIENIIAYALKRI